MSPVRLTPSRPPPTMASPTVQLVLIAATAAGAAGLALADRDARPQHFIAADHPTAVLAWARMRCDTNLELRDGVPRAHKEDVLQVAGAYETSLRHRAIDTACEEALQIAAPLIAAGRAHAQDSPAARRAMLAIR